MRLNSLQEVAEWLEFAPQNLYYLVAMRDELYVPASIPKRSSGGYRRIYIPNSELKGVQRELLRRILYQWDVNSRAYAYVPGRSLYQAAERLSGDKAVLQIDIKDFFPSISSGRVYRLFCRRGFSYSASYVLTNLVTFKDKLTQGAPTSPYLSNLLVSGMDTWLSRFARAWGLEYLRYSDDLFFYGPQDFSHKTFAPYAHRIINRYGLRVNRKKQAYHPRGKPRFTLGLATHGVHPQIPRAKRRRIRAAFYNGSKNPEWAAKRVDELTGLAEWYRSVYGTDERYADYRKVIDNVRSTRFHEPFTV